jgi:signal transduction histidine kinase
MNIRTRLTLQFAAIVAVIVLLSHLSIYYFSSQYRATQFQTRLREKAKTTADLLINVDDISAELLRIINRNKKDLLFQENVTVYNFRNEILYTNNPKEDFGSDPDFLNKVRSTGEQILVSEDVELVAILYNDDYNRYVITASATDTYGLRKLGNLLEILTGSFLLIMIIVIVTGWFYAGRALRPINKMVKKVNEISASNLGVRLEEGNGKDEISRLAGTFNKMLDRIERSFRMQKTFVANASHEIKNPLTVITSQVEVALLRDRTTEEYKQTLTSVLEDVRRLNRFSKRLLDLARVDTDSLNAEFAPLRIDELIWNLLEDFRRKNPDYSVQFAPELPENEGLLILNGSSDLLIIALINVIENGCKFSPDHKVIFTLHASEAGCTLTCADNGPGIPKDDAAMIFEPFYRGKNTVGVPGHGIGLSLVKRIVSLHGGTITLDNAAGTGTVVSIFLPREAK